MIVLTADEIDALWFAIGMLGQVMFFMRFFVQWLASEKYKKSTVPDAFWYFSIAGGAILLTYAIYKDEWVFIVGQAAGLLIYIRNIYLIKTQHMRDLNPVADPAADREEAV